jgi:hypothetical protein
LPEITHDGATILVLRFGEYGSDRVSIRRNHGIGSLLFTHCPDTDWSTVFDLRPVEANLDPTQRLHPFDGSKFNRYDERRINPPTKYFMPKTSRSTALSRPIEHHIYVIRRRKVMLDRDLAALYGVSTGALNQAVRRHRERFPDDFMFTLDRKESENLKSQTVISS